MFTGLIEDQGEIRRRDDLAGGGATFHIAVPTALRCAIAVKDSISVSGVCLTATKLLDEGFACDVVPETLVRSALGKARSGDRVNLELSLRFGDRLGGHLVYGHVDATARIVALREEGQGHRLTVEVPSPLADFIVEKGYVAVDGVSLTVASVGPRGFDIALIPETSRRTTLGQKRTGALVSLEADPIARYAIAAVKAYSKS